MSRFSTGTLLVILLLVVIGVGPVAYVGWRESQGVSLATPVPGQSSAEALPYTYIIDVEGWYRITANERAVSSPYDLSWDHLAALPLTIGEWKGTDVGVGPEIVEWFDTPDISVRRLYMDSQGRQMWLSFFGSRGRKSYALFEHTPATSYPAAGWTLLDNRVEAIPVQRGHVNVQKAVLEKDGERRVVLYWYLWSDPRRDPEKGVLTVRLHAIAPGDESQILAAASSFLRLIFPESLPWQRF